MLSTAPVRSFVAESAEGAIPPGSDSLLGNPGQRDFELAYIVARQLIDGLDWKWVTVTWLQIPNHHRPRPVLYGLPARALRTPSDENLPLPLTRDGQAETRPFYEPKRDATTGEPLPRPEWVLPCQADEPTTLAFWAAVFAALPRDPLPLLKNLDTNLPDTLQPFSHLVQFVPPRTEAEIPIPAEIDVSPVRQLLAASLSQDGSLSYAVVREGFIDRSVGPRREEQKDNKA